MIGTKISLFLLIATPLNVLIANLALSEQSPDASHCGPVPSRSSSNQWGLTGGWRFTKGTYVLAGDRRIYFHLDTGRDTNWQQSAYAMNYRNLSPAGSPINLVYDGAGLRAQEWYQASPDLVRTFNVHSAYNMDPVVFAIKDDLNLHILSQSRTSTEPFSPFMPGPPGAVKAIELTGPKSYDNRFSVISVIGYDNKGYQFTWDNFHKKAINPLYTALPNVNAKQLRWEESSYDPASGYIQWVLYFIGLDDQVYKQVYLYNSNVGYGDYYTGTAPALVTLSSPTLFVSGQMKEIVGVISKSEGRALLVRGFDGQLYSSGLGKYLNSKGPYQLAIPGSMKVIKPVPDHGVVLAVGYDNNLYGCRFDTANLVCKGVYSAPGQWQMMVGGARALDASSCYFNAGMFEGISALGNAGVRFIGGDWKVYYLSWVMDRSFDLPNPFSPKYYNYVFTGGRQELTSKIIPIGTFGAIPIPSN